MSCHQTFVRLLYVFRSLGYLALRPSLSLWVGITQTYHRAVKTNLIGASLSEPHTGGSLSWFCTSRVQTARTIKYDYFISHVYDRLSVEGSMKCGKRDLDDENVTDMKKRN